MKKLSINVTDERREFFPGETMTGTVSWELDENPGNMELRLFWYTRGKGTEDVSVVEIIRFENAMLQDTQDFEFNLPMDPYSFSGKLISLKWALELVPEKGKSVERYKFAMSQTGRPVVLKAVESD